jgi:hypothetical protein
MFQDRSLSLAIVVIIVLLLFIANEKVSFKNDPKSIIKIDLEEKPIQKIYATKAMNSEKLDTQTKTLLNEESVTKRSNLTKISEKHTLRDFRRFPCKERRRIGGQQQFIDAAKDPLYRIDGAWYVCFDEPIKPKINSCIVYSFGINADESFDYKMNHDYGCHVYSFDPFVEAGRFAQIRRSSQALNDAYEIKVNDKWRFYRIGIQGPRSNVKIPQDLRISSMLNFDEILELTGQKNKTLDVFKMDIENGERSVLEQIDMDYFCEYVKQFELEIHPDLRKEARALLGKLEQCFFLYYRDTRFYMHERGGNTGYLTEFQLKHTGVAIELASFRDDIEMADYIFTMGELYFINSNFL